MKPKSFRPRWFVYPHTGIALIVFNEEELAEQEAQMGNGEFIREATKAEQEYQTSGIPEMVAQYFSIISGAPIGARIETKNSGVAS